MLVIDVLPDDGAGRTVELIKFLEQGSLRSALCPFGESLRDSYSIIVPAIPPIPAILLQFRRVIPYRH